MAAEVIAALITAFLVPALFEMWKRRHAAHPSEAESIIVGLLVLVGGGLLYYFALSLPFEVEDFFLDLLLLLFKIALILVGTWCVIVGGVVAWTAFSDTPRQPDRN